MFLISSADGAASTLVPVAMISTETLLALEHDERAGLGPGHIRACGNGCNNHALYHIRVGIRNQHAAEVALADLLEQTAQLRLKMTTTANTPTLSALRSSHEIMVRCRKLANSMISTRIRIPLASRAALVSFQQLHNTVK